jgi:hypothetical protein
MQRCKPHQTALLVAIAVTGTDVAGVDPAFNRAGTTLDGIRGHGFFSVDGVLFAHPQANPAAGAPVIVDDRHFFNNLNSLYRAIPDTKPAADAFVGVYLHG